MEAKKLNNLTISEYIEIEKDTDTKYEYHNGSIFAMAGGTLNHVLICGNIFGEIRAVLRSDNRNCKVMNSEIKLYIQSKNSFLYPDAMVICGDIEKSHKEPNSVTNPIVIVEVFSKSTESYDRGDKFYLYRQIKSLQEYILIDQVKVQIEIYRREVDLWRITRINGIENKLFITSLDINIELKDIYENIETPLNNE